MQQQAKPPMGAGSKRDFQMMAAPAQQPLAYPGQAQVPAQAGGSGGLPDGSAQQMTGMLSMPPAQPASSFTNGPSFPSSSFEAAGTKNGASVPPITAAGPSNPFPPSSTPYQEHPATLHTMASSSSAHTQNLYSTGSSMLQALGSREGPPAFLMPPQQQQQMGAAGLQHEQAMGQLPLRGQPPPFGQFADRQLGCVDGPAPTSPGMLAMLEGTSPYQVRPTPCLVLKFLLRLSAPFSFLLLPPPPGSFASYGIRFLSLFTAHFYPCLYSLPFPFLFISFPSPFRPLAL